MSSKQVFNRVIDWRYNVGIVNPALCDHILQEFNTLYLTRLRTYKISLPPQTNLRGEGGLIQKNLPQSPFTGQFFIKRHLALLSIGLIFLRLQEKRSDWRLFSVTH
jgi:hypothetical protein